MTGGRLTPAATSVLDELGLDPSYVVKARLAMRIQKTIAELGLGQREAAARMPISQPKLSLLVRGKLDDISQATLEDCLRALGHDIGITISPRHEGPGAVTVTVREVADSRSDGRWDSFFEAPGVDLDEQAA